MRKEDFWRKGQYPITPADNKQQPSDNIRWQQLQDYYESHDTNVVPPQRVEEKRRYRDLGVVPHG